MLFRYSLTTKLGTVVTTNFYQSTHVKFLDLCRGSFLFAVYFNFGRSCTRGLPVRIHWDHTIWLDISFKEKLQISAILIGLVSGIIIVRHESYL